MPSIIKIFSRLLPRMLPIAMPVVPANAAEMLIAASGALVPNATMVSPMTICGIWNFSAMPDAPSTKKSAPFIKIKKPATINKTLFNANIIFLQNARGVHRGHFYHVDYLNFTAVPYAITSAAPCMTAADA